MIPLLAVITVFLLMAGGFAWFLVRQDKGEREPVTALWAAFGFGVLGVIMAATLEQFVIPNVFDEKTHAIGVIIVAAIGVGVVEELAKCLPLMSFIYKKRYFNEHTDGIIYFALAGLGFGLPENILYTLQFGAGAGLARLIMTPLFHAATTALIGYAFARVKVGHAPKKFLYKTIALAISVHALYDFGLLSGMVLFVIMSLALTVAMTVSLFVLYAKSKELDQAVGLSVVGNNAFCRSCGHPNPKHNLYCSQCGNRA